LRDRDVLHLAAVFFEQRCDVQLSITRHSCTAAQGRPLTMQWMT
jgi:hypothetical protein